jgi:hypothetical protein
MSNTNGENFVLIGLVIAFLGLIVTFTVPEIRNYFGLGQDETPSSEFQVLPAKPDTPSIKVPSFDGSTEYTIHENSTYFVEEAKANLTVSFQESGVQELVHLIICPSGQKTFCHAMLTGDTKEFTSSAGVFLVQILSVDYDNKKVSIQVSRKS